MENKTLFSKTDKTPKAMRGQAALVYEALSADGQTVEQITEKILANLVTRQDPMRISAYYLCVFKKQGLVTAVRPTPPVAEAKVEEPTVDAPATEEPSDIEPSGEQLVSELPVLNADEHVDLIEG